MTLTYCWRLSDSSKKDPDEILQESRFLLDMDFDNLMNAGIYRQSYWVRAMQAARKAGRQTAALAGKVSASVRRSEQSPASY